MRNHTWLTAVSISLVLSAFIFIGCAQTGFIKVHREDAVPAQVIESEAPAKSIFDNPTPTLGERVDGVDQSLAQVVLTVSYLKSMLELNARDAQEILADHERGALTVNETTRIRLENIISRAK
jgi:hypothetical protein